MPRRAVMRFVAIVSAASASECARNEPLPPEAFVVAPAECAPTAIDGDVQLDVDIRAVRLEGTFLIDGARIPGGVSGGLSFREHRTKAPGFFLLDDSGGDFSVLLPRGIYDIVYQPPAERCALAATTPFPCSPAILARDVELGSGSVRRDLQVSTVRIRGAVRVDAGDAPIEDGALIFTPRDVPFGRAMFAPLLSDHSYDVRLAPGTYDVGWMPPASCVTNPDPRVPCSAGSVGRTVVVASDATVDLTLATGMLDAMVTIDGASVVPAPPSTALLFEGTDDNIFLHDLTAGTTIHRRLLRGDYTVTLRHSVPCSSGGEIPWPCGDHVVVDRLRVANDLSTTIDITTARVRGEVTLGGSMFPQIPGPRGLILWRDVALRNDPIVNDGLRESRNARATILGTGGPASFDLRLPPGRYDVLYERGTACSASDPLPCSTSILAQDVTVEADGVHDFDLRPVTLRVDLHRTGADLVEQFARGALRLMPLEAREMIDIPLPSTGPARIETRVVPGRYRVSFVGPPQPCEAIACGVTVIRDDVRIDANTTWSFDVPHATVRGAITLNGFSFTPPPGAGITLNAFGVDNGQEETLFLTDSSYRLGILGSGRYYFVVGPFGGCSRSSPQGTLCAPEIVGCD